MAKSVKISAVIITFNEEQNIGRCFGSLNEVADEVVVDSFSTDKTEEICNNKGARFIQNPFKGHIEQKNYAASRAKHGYILSLDGDEALSEELRFLYYYFSGEMPDRAKRREICKKIWEITLTKNTLVFELDTSKSNSFELPK